MTLKTNVLGKGSQAQKWAQFDSIYKKSDMEHSNLWSEKWEAWLPLGMS